ncbi:MAG: sel1 repeat family protein, partial [Bacteroidaceae bacterium]|nr:sel1 repeat family protein [Bacteroidaceae bacterium]
TDEATPKQPEEVPMDSATLAACEYHHERAMIYYNQKRYKDALTMFIELAQHRYAPSIYYIGLCYLNGTGLTKNEQQAYRFISDAAECGEARAMYDLAVMTENGTGTEADKVKAHDLFTKAAEQNEPRALVEMGHRYLDGTMVPQDKVKAEEFLRKGTELKFPVAMLEYGKLLQADGRDGLKHIRAAADEKNEEALQLMIEHERNAGNNKKVYKFARELHLLGNHTGTKIMADCYYEGKGIGRDKSLAKDLYREAANAGNEEAKEKLKEI